MNVHSCWRIQFNVLSVLTKVQKYFKHILKGFENGLKEKNLKKNKRRSNTSPSLYSGPKALSFLSCFFSLPSKPRPERPSSFSHQLGLGTSQRTHPAQLEPRPSQVPRFPPFLPFPLGPLAARVEAGPINRVVADPCFPSTDSPVPRHQSLTDGT